MQTTEPRTIDLGACNRDAAGRFVKTYTLAYETTDARTGEPVKVVRHLPAKGVEVVGQVIARSDRVWGVYVLDGTSSEYDPNLDVTDEFDCFA